MKTNNAYKLIDFGNGVKVEQFADKICIRPETNAINTKLSKNINFWKQKADFIYNSDKVDNGAWNTEHTPEWIINLQTKKYNIKLILQLGTSKHIGVFPEQVYNWNFIYNNVKANHKVLNLFAYTGAASLIAAKKASQVTHIDSSRTVVKTAIENAKLNNTTNIKFINDDALLFCKKEVKRNNRYDFVILDPPVYGFATKNRQWKIQKDLKPLLESIKNITNKNAFILMNIYTKQFHKDKVVKLIDEIFGKNRLVKQGYLSLTDSFNKKLILNDYFIIKT